MDKNDIWSKLAAPLPAGSISWRQDGRPSQRDGRFFARFVAYVDANTVRERLDSVVPGEWDLTLDLLPPLPSTDGEDSAACSFKARLQILGVIREDVGTGRDYKAAATDAFKRAAVRFGIAHELYAYEQNWVQVDGDSKYAKPLEDPAVAYARRWGGASNGTSDAAAPREVAFEAPARSTGAHASNGSNGSNGSSGSNGAGAQPAAASAPAASEEPHCPKCGGRMWDNRLTKRNPKAPDFKCRDRACDGVIWPPKNQGQGAPAASAAPSARGAEPLVPEMESEMAGADDLPF